MKVCVLTSGTFGNKQVSEPPGQVQSYFSVGQVVGTLIIKQFTSELSHFVSILQVIQVITGWLHDFFTGLVQVEQFFRRRMYTIALFWGSGAGCVSFHQKMHTRFSEFPSSHLQVRNLDKTLHIYLMNLGELYVIRGRHRIPSLLSIKGMFRNRSLFM